MIALSEITAKLVGLQYEFGKMDCFQLVREYMKLRGIEAPAEHRDRPFQEYYDLYETDKAAAVEALCVGYMDDHLEPAQHPEKAAPGDIYLLSLRGKDCVPFLAIDGGNGNMVCASEKMGVSVVPLRYYKKERAWKCQQRFRHSG